jgi:hypothetical protein
MEIIQGKDSFNEMATGILVKLLQLIPLTQLSNIRTSLESRTRTVRLTFLLTLDTLIYYIKVISTDMDYTAKLTPLGSSILNHKPQVQARRLSTSSKV